MRPCDGQVSDGDNIFTAIKLRAAAALLLAPLTAACAGGPPVSPYKAVLTAGDTSTHVFDHATDAMYHRLLAGGTAPADIQRFSASPRQVAKSGIGMTSLAAMRRGIEAARPSGRQACFVFATSHGALQKGLYLEPQDEFLTQALLDDALSRGCGEAPTVAIISGCYSGGFARAPMARPNRVILTASREDRNSFGCSDDFEYTVFDRCLLDAMERAETWPAAHGLIRSCVTAKEQALGFQASEPQAYFGASTAGLTINGRR